MTADQYVVVAGYIVFAALCVAAFASVVALLWWANESLNDSYRRADEAMDRLKRGRGNR